VPTLFDHLPRRQQLALAVRTKDPAQMARTLACHCGQFYNRAPFDAVARDVYALYAVDSEASARCFRHRLDQQLRERFRPAVAWDSEPRRGEEAT
jgi:hypothetical protein